MKSRLALLSLLALLAGHDSAAQQPLQGSQEALERWQQALYGTVLYKELACPVRGFEPGMVSSIYDAEVRLRSLAGTLATKERENTVREDARRVAAAPYGNCQTATKSYERIALAIIGDESAVRRAKAQRADEERQKAEDAARQREERARQAEATALREAAQRRDAEERARAEAAEAARLRAALARKQEEETQRAIAEERRRAEEQRLVETRAEEQKRMAELRLAEEQKKAAQRLEDERRQAEEQKSMAELRLAEEQKKAAQRLEDERRQAEEKRTEAARVAEAKLAAERRAAVDRLYRATCLPRIAPAGMSARLIKDPIKKLTLNSVIAEFEEAISHAVASEGLRKAFTEKMAELVRMSSDVIRAGDGHTSREKPNSMPRALAEMAKRNATVFAELGELTYRNCLFDAFDVLEVEKTRLERWLS